MAITYSLSPNPHWVVIDNFSKLPNGAVIYTYSSLNPSIFKPAFEDAGGAIPYGKFIQGFGNGTFPPIFWEFDSNNPTDLYYIEVWSAPQQEDGGNGVLLWDFDGLSGGGSGGGGIITTNLDLDNLVINGQFYRNVGNLPLSPATTLANQITLAPSNHDGFVGAGTTPNFEPVGPDIIFAKSNGTETDSISFVNFTQGSNFFGTTPTPQQYVRYTSNASGTANYKFIQFPLVKGLQNLNNQNVSVQMWNFLNSGSTNIKLSLRQFFGNGSNAPSADVVTDMTDLNLSANVWTQTMINSFLVPSIGGKTLGNCGNDALYLQLIFPASEAIDLSFILPAIYIGDTTSKVDFHTLDYVDGIVNSPRTGDIRTSINSFSPYGWVAMNDGTIGSGSSNATARANIDTFPLFDLIWNAFQANQPLAPMYTSSGAPTAYGASSVADFSANNQLALTRNSGRVMAGSVPTAISQSFTNTGNVLTVASTASFITGSQVLVSGGSIPSPLLANVNYYAIILSNTTMSLASSYSNALSNTAITLTTNGSGTVTAFPQHILGSFVGEEQHLQLASEIAEHSHPFSVPFSNQAASRGGGGADTVTNLVAFNSNTSLNPGGGFPFNVMQPTVYMNVFVKL